MIIYKNLEQRYPDRVVGLAPAMLINLAEYATFPLSLSSYRGFGGMKTPLPPTN